MSKSALGLVTGLTLGFAGYFGGFGAFLVVAALGALGLIVGSFLQGDFTIGDFVQRRAEDKPPRDEMRQSANRARSQGIGQPQHDSMPPRSRVR